MTLSIFRTRLVAGVVSVLVAMTGLAFALSVGLPAASAPAAPGYEVWAIDQADAARGGAWLYIYNGQALESGQIPQPERINLFTAATGVGDGPGVRPHMLAFSPTYSHATISNVATGHVYVMRTSDRKLVASIDIGEQVHHSEVSPDGQWILASNQNGKRLARIRADFAAERFTHERDQDINLAALEDRTHPDNAPICPIIIGGKGYIRFAGAACTSWTIARRPCASARRMVTIRSHRQGVSEPPSVTRYISTRGPQPRQISMCSTATPMP